MRHRALVRTPASPAPSTDIAVFSVSPYLDHPHVGSFLRVTDRPE